MELPPMSDDEAKLWYEEEWVQALAYYCTRTGVPSTFAFSFFVTSPPVL